MLAMPCRIVIWSSVVAFTIVAVAAGYCVWHRAAGEPSGYLGRFRVTGRVIDERGNPVVGADVSDYWDFDDDRRVPNRDPRTITDDAGRFTRVVEFYGEGTALHAVDKERRSGGIVVLGPKNHLDQVEIRAVPLVQVKGTLTCCDLERALPWGIVYVSVLPARLRIDGLISTDETFAFKLPPGRYALKSYGYQSADRFDELVISGDTSVIKVAYELELSDSSND